MCPSGPKFHGSGVYHWCPRGLYSTELQLAISSQQKVSRCLPPSFKKWLRHNSSKISKKICMFLQAIKGSHRVVRFYHYFCARKSNPDACALSILYRYNFFCEPSVGNFQGVQFQKWKFFWRFLRCFSFFKVSVSQGGPRATGDRMGTKIKNKSRSHIFLSLGG